MILVVFGTLYAICLAIVALVFVRATPLRARSDTGGDARAPRHHSPAPGRDEFATHA